MDTKDIIRRLTDKQKERLAGAKTEEDLKALALEDEELAKAVGGWNIGGSCYQPVFRELGDYTCYLCGTPIGPNDTKCPNPNCRAKWENSYGSNSIYSVICPACGGLIGPSGICLGCGFGSTPTIDTTDTSNSGRTL